MPSLQKVSRTISTLLLSFKVFDQIQDGAESLLLLPNITLFCAWITLIFGAYISWTEEETGEDGMALESVESSDDGESVNFKLKETSREGIENPKYSPFQKWKWYTFLYQFSYILQLCVTFIWFFEYTAVESFEESELLEGSNFHEQMVDYTLHVLPFMCLLMEYLTNSQPFVDRHFWYVTMPFLVANLAKTLILEHVYGIKLYMIDLNGVPYFNISVISLSIPLFYILKGLSYAKLKVQGYPCDKILEEIQEYFDDVKNKEETAPMIKDLEMESNPSFN